ncbi:Bug family tripartite tricarboxylate transporter substrate binding protein [Nitrincola sp.]|uniref:Bug family tripartite tricarboxylate transporter substrate binding protein n=1 Tax=Nitrincola sp. TaxID=1926584 RepID=UPI003A90C3A8
MIKQSLISCALAGSMLFGSMAVQAYEFERPVRIVVPFAPGGTSDILARLIAPELSTAIGQPVIVENKPGASGNIGADYVAKVNADGHTLLLMDVAALATAPHLYSNLSYDPVNDLAPVTMVSFSPYIMAVNPKLGVSSVEEMVALGKSDPRALSAANSGIGGANHIASVLVGDHLDLDWSIIPYRGGSDASRAVVSGESTVLINGSTATKPFVLSEQLTAVAVTGPSRLTDLPDVPTFTELDMPGENMGSWQGILTTGGSPADAIERLNAELQKIIESEDMQERIAGQGAVAANGSSQEMIDWLADNHENMGVVIEQYGIKIE